MVKMQKELNELLLAFSLCVDTSMPIPAVTFAEPLEKKSQHCDPSPLNLSVCTSLLTSPSTHAHASS